MSELIVIGFPDESQGPKIIADFKAMQKNGGVELRDAMLVTKNADGKLQIKDEAGHPVAWGAVIGGALGGLLFLVMPVVGAVAGAAVGGAIAHWLDLGVDRKFVEQWGETLQPNTSALFLLLGEGSETAAVQALKPYQGTLLQTNVSSDLEAQLKRVLEKED